MEFARYIRERDRAEIAHAEAIKASEKTRLEAVLHSTRVAGDEASVEREIAAADKARGLDEDDDDSDVETEILSIVEHPKAADSDPSNKRARRFLFTFIEEVLSSIRSWESSVLHLAPAGKSGHGKNNKGLPTTLNFNTSSDGMTCILSQCGKVHKNKNNKPSKSLAFCEYFLKRTKW
mgnify:FL=1